MHIQELVVVEAGKQVLVVETNYHLSNWGTLTELGKTVKNQYKNFGTHLQPSIVQERSDWGIFENIWSVYTNIVDRNKLPLELKDILEFWKWKCLLVEAVDSIKTVDIILSPHCTKRSNWEQFEDIGGIYTEIINRKTPIETFKKFRSTYTSIYDVCCQNNQLSWVSTQHIEPRRDKLRQTSANSS